MALPLVTCGESKWAFVTRWELFFPFTRGKPLVKGKSPCLRLSLKALRHLSCIGNFEENMDLSDIYLAVNRNLPNLKTDTKLNLISFFLIFTFQYILTGS